MKNDRVEMNAETMDKVIGGARITDKKSSGVRLGSQQRRCPVCGGVNIRHWTEFRVLIIPVSCWECMDCNPIGTPNGVR